MLRLCCGIPSVCHRKSRPFSVFELGSKRMRTRDGLIRGGRFTCRRLADNETCMTLKRCCLCFLLMMFLTVPAWPQQQSQDLTTQSIEDLMNITVTSVSKTEQTLSRTAAAVFVISQVDIAQSGATNIPDLLRAVPGMDVSEINGNTWAISTRGLNGRFSNELLVLIDGRPVYTQTSGGVYWDTVDLPLEDIERIEVIRGPGGSVWGANAVNGVVNS